MTYKAVTGRVTIPGTDLGVRARVTATPMSTGHVLSFDDRITWGSRTVETDNAGNMPTGSSALKIPQDSTLGDEVLWKFTADPIDRVAGIKKWTIATQPITADTTIQALVTVDVTMVSAELATTVGENAAAAAASEDAAAASATAAAGSATSAGTAKTGAETAQTAAAGSATAASGSASAASTSATSASTSAGTATTKASEASTSATAAAGSATAAAGSATAAAGSATSAATAKTGAETAQGLAEDARDDVVAVVATTDGLVTAVDANASSAFRVQQDARLSASYVRPRGGTTATTVAKPLVVNIRDFGAKSDTESFMFDNTTAIQAAIDYVSSEGGGIVDIPGWTPGGGSDRFKDITYRFTQIIMKWGVHLRGTGMFYGTRLHGLGNLDMIRFQADASGNYIAPCKITDLHIRGKFGSTAGCGIATRDASGNPLSLQHGVTFSHISTEDHAEDGLLILGGSGVNDVDNILGYMNGGYGTHLKGSTIQMVGLTNIYGDGNVAGAALCIEDTIAGYAVNILNLKSEQIVNANRGSGSVPSQPNALHLKNVQGAVNIDGFQHISSVNNNYKPGNGIVVSGANRPESLTVRGQRIRYPYGTQTTGSDPVLLHDTVAGAGADIALSTADLVYYGSVDHSQATSVKVPTASGGDNSTRAASTAFVAAGYQPLDTDLTAIAALTTTSFGRALLTAADAAGLAGLAGLAGRYGDQLTTGQETVSRETANLSTIPLSNNGAGAATMRLCYFTARKSETVTKIRTVSGGTAAGATPTLSRLGIYTVAGNGDLTLVASTANDTTLWSSANTAYDKALSSSYAVVAGTRYAVAELCLSTATAPTVCGQVAGPAADIGVGPRLSGNVSGLTDLPSSVSAGSVTDTTNRVYAVLLP